MPLLEPNTGRASLYWALLALIMLGLTFVAYLFTPDHHGRHIGELDVFALASPSSVAAGSPSASTTLDFYESEEWDMAKQGLKTMLELCLMGVVAATRGFYQACRTRRAFIVLQAQGLVPINSEDEIVPRWRHNTGILLNTAFGVAALAVINRSLYFLVAGPDLYFL